MGVREYVLATSAEEAARLVGQPGTALMGGGTLLMPRATAGTLGAERVVGLQAAGLDYVRRNGATAIGPPCACGTRWRAPWQRRRDDRRMRAARARERACCFATRLVAERGGHVIAPALSEDERYLRELEAAEIVEPNGDVVAAVRERYPDGVDSLIDLVSFDPATFAATAATLGRGGRAVSPTNSADPDADGIVATNIAAYERPQALAEVAKLIDEGKLAVAIA